MLAAMVLLGGLLARTVGAAPQDGGDDDDPAIATLPVRVNLAIDRGIQKLLSWQHQDGSFQTGASGNYPMGVTALAAYTLLKSGLPADDPAIRRAIESMQYLEFRKTYSVAVLLLALDALHDPTRDEWIRAGAAWLEEHFNRSKRRWGYPEPNEDLSNTQYAVLGLWAAGRHGHQSRKSLWLDVLKEMADQQNRDGGYGYREADRPFSSGSMTTAGITCIAVAMLELEGQREFEAQNKRTQAMLDRAWAYMDHVFSVEGNPEHGHGQLTANYHYYYLYGLERVAALGDRRTIGGRNWYREGAHYLLQNERKEGGWGSLEDTCFALLFLRRATFSGLSTQQALAATPRAVTWRYTTSKPADDWMKPDFDARRWGEGAGAFGRFDVPDAPVRTLWQTPDLWIRRTFAWRLDPAEFRLFVHHDDAAEIYVNGVLAAQVPGAQHHYAEVEVSAAARAALQADGNVIAAHGHNAGGQQSLDIVFHDVGGGNERRARFEAGERWGESAPRPEVPFLRRWLVLGPVTDDRHSFLLDELPGEPALQPADGDRDYNTVWRTHVNAGATLDFLRAARAAESCGYFAATYLDCAETTDAVLWFGSDDGARVYLDELPVFSRHAHQPLQADQFRVPLRLRKGVHRLLFKVEQVNGACELMARLSAPDGGLLPSVRAVLQPSAPDLAAAARAQPVLTPLPDLAALLLADPKSSVTFDSVNDVDRVIVGPCHPDDPQWWPRSEVKTAWRPAPGAKGLLSLRPASADVPARLCWKVAIPSVRDTLSVRVSPETQENAGKAAFRLRLGVVADGSLHPVAEQLVESHGPASARDWAVISGDVSAWSGQEVMVVLEVASPGDGRLDLAYVDEIALD